jgi:His/Glu/Gln/Arg/opine family amino acid ABC transporter permease subunit
MTSMTDVPDSPLPLGRQRARRPPGGRVVHWLRANLFSSIPNAIITLLLVFVLGKAAVSLVQWGYLNAIWSVPGNDTSACRALRGLGACWAVIPEKYRFILFGTYPYDQQWRPAAATLVFIALFAVSSRRRFWRAELMLVWIAALVAIGLLMWGGLFGMSLVSQDRWGGLPVTLILATFGLAFGFPLGILVALGRRSKLPAIRSLCVLYVELIRGVPLISLLFMASVMFPLFMPDGVNIDKLLARPDRLHPLRRRLPRRSRARRPAGGAARTIRGRRRARPVLLAEERPGHFAAGDPPRDPAARQHLHRLLQGYQPGADHRHLRFADYGENRDHRSRLAVVQRRGLCVRRTDLFRVLLRNVAV